MKSVESRLRAAAAAAADTVPAHGAAPLRLPERSYRFALPRLRGRALAIVAPLAAATAMSALIAATAIAHSAAATPSPSAGAGPSGDQALRQLPPFYVALTYQGRFSNRKIPHTDAVVASTVSGHQLVKIAPPKPYNNFVAVSGSADGSSYVLAAQDQVKRFQQHAATKFFELRITSRDVSITALPTPVLRAMRFSNIALSADGSQLAVSGTWPGRSGNFSQTTGVRVYDLATGQLAHSWAVLPPPPPGKCCVFSPTAGALSWEANGRYLALDVSLAHCEDCVTLLDTQAAGPSVQAIGKVIVRTRNRHYQVIWTNTIIAPDGNRVLRSAMVFVPITKHSSYPVPRVFTYSTASGNTIATMRGDRVFQWTVLWSSQDGRSLVVSSSRPIVPGSFITAAIYSGGHATPVTLPAQTLTVAW